MPDMLETLDMSEPIISAIKKLAKGQALEDSHLQAVFRAMLTGEATPEHIAAFLMGLAVTGETAPQMLAGAQTLRANARKIDLPFDVLDTCGTGGLGWTSVNTSTASAIVIAAAGGKVAKHGNRSVPPKTGSADVLEALGVNLDISEAQFHACLEKAGVAFMFAPAHHAAMRHVGPVRKMLGIRTIFNLLGPLSNPAQAQFQILGVNEERWLMPMAETLKALGVKRAWVVYGLDGIDELSISGWTAVADIVEGDIRLFEISVGELDIEKHPLEALQGGDPAHNAQALRGVLAGEKSAFREAVRYNAGAGLFVSGLAPSLGRGIEIATYALDSGKAEKTLQTLVTLSNAEA